MSTESYLEAPHYRHPTGGTQSSVEYEAGEESSASSMDNHTAAGYKNNSVSSLGYPHDVATFDARSKRSAHQQHHSQALPSQLQLQPQHAFSNSSQPLSGFATPQSSPHSPGGSPQRSTHDGKAYPYSSGSEDDHEALPSQEPPLLGDLPRAGPYRPRRDSGAPPIKMAAAKRLPPFNNGLSSIPAELHVTEEQEEEDLEGRAHRSDYHENGADSMPHHDEEQQPMQMSDRDKDPREASNISKAAVNGGLTQSKQLDVYLMIGQAGPGCMVGGIQMALGWATELKKEVSSLVHPY
ncbi:hypothetical protein BGZ99_004197 [Dissophora globulifera]|uniref:Uncharacterized protein n=1 Tax=Dissophora globulifera TaxID=979702 RepID=A0A9P6RXM1_9FUNG|nr:hypothetical protein BGZ99_004197 [Dissophora globulifera]